MMSFKSIGTGKDASAAANYYENLAREDYYNEGGEPPGKWIGEQAKTLNIDGDVVEKGQLQRGFEGFHPVTNQPLAKNAGEGHKAGYDFVFSAPKSVSTIWAIADNQARRDISFAQQNAVEKAVRFAEKNAFHTRTGHAGEYHIKHTEGVVAATFEHSTSREGDPQLHTHTIVLNITSDGKRLDFDSRWKMAIGAAYRSELTTELQKMGYTIERDGSSFEISGVPQDLQRELSTRRQQIEVSLREKGLIGNAKAAGVAALDTRIQKGDVNRDLLVKESRELAAKFGFTQEIAQSLRTESVQALFFDKDKFVKDLTQNASTLSEQQLQSQYYQSMQGVGYSMEELITQLKQIQQESLVELVDPASGESRWTTEEMQQIESSIAESSINAHAEKSHFVDEAFLESALAAKTLSNEQISVLRYVVAEGRIKVVQGVAGAGKSYMLDAARDSWEKQGYEVIGVALSGKAAEGLQQSASIKSDTIHKTLIQLEKGDIKLNSNTIVVMDEAGMTGSRLMNELQKHVDEAGAKLVLVGDTRQLQPVDAGGAMRAIQERIGAIEMNEIRRQQDPMQRDIVKDFAEGRTLKAIQKLESIDRVKTHDNYKAAIRSIADATIIDMKEAKTSIALAGTKSEVRELNQEIRNAAIRAEFVKSDDKLFNTELGARNFAEGDRVIFLKNDRELGVRNGTTGTVEKAFEGKLQIKIDNGKQIKLDQERYNKVDHGYAYTVHKSQGITVDRAHYKPGQMNDKELSYVAGSRHRESFTVHTTKEGLDEFKQSSQHSHLKDTSLDYIAKENHTHNRSVSIENKNEKVIAPVRMQKRNLNIENDAILAKHSMATRGKMPDSKQLRKDIENGKASWTKDSKGERYLQYRDGRTYNNKLHTNNRETSLRQASKIGDKRALIVDKYLIDFKIAGQRVQALKAGTQVLISRDTASGKAIGKMADSMKSSREGRNGERGLVNDLKYKIEQKLDQNQGWRKATLQESVRARLSVVLENRSTRNESKQEMQSKINAAEKESQPKGRVIESNIMSNPAVNKEIAGDTPRKSMGKSQPTNERSNSKNSAKISLIEQIKSQIALKTNSKDNEKGKSAAVKASHDKPYKEGKSSLLDIGSDDKNKSEISTSDSKKTTDKQKDNGMGM